MGISCHVAWGTLVSCAGPNRCRVVQGWTRLPVVTHGLVPAGKGHGESPRGGRERGALGVTSPLNGVPRRQLFVRLLQKGFGFSLSSALRVLQRPRLLQRCLTWFSHLSSSLLMVSNGGEGHQTLPLFARCCLGSRCIPVPHGAVLELGSAPGRVWTGVAEPFPIWNLFPATYPAYLFNPNSCETRDMNQAGEFPAGAAPQPSGVGVAFSAGAGILCWESHPAQLGAGLSITTQPKSLLHPG